MTFGSNDSNIDVGSFNTLLLSLELRRTNHEQCSFKNFITWKLCIFHSLNAAILLLNMIKRITKLLFVGGSVPTKESRNWIWSQTPIFSNSSQSSGTLGNGPFQAYVWQICISPQVYSVLVLSRNVYFALLRHHEKMHSIFNRLNMTS